MARFQLVYFILSTLFGTSFCEYCYSYSYSIYNYNSYRTTKYCPFGCCGTTFQYCCVTNAGYIVGIVAAVIFCISVIVTIVCCCRRRNSRMATTTVVGVPTTLVGGPTTVINPHATYITPNAPPHYPSVMYSNNYASAQVEMTPPYQPYPYPNQGGVVGSGNGPLPSKQDNPFDPPSYSSPAAYGYNS